MSSKTFKAVTIVSPEAGSHWTLTEAFNAWAQAERPSAIVHVHYYRDTRSHVRGYQIVYEEAPDGQERRKNAGPVAKSTLPDHAPEGNSCLPSKAVGVASPDLSMRGREIVSDMAGTCKHWNSSPAA